MTRAWQGIVGQAFTPEDFQTYATGLDFSDWLPEFCVLHNTMIPRFSDWHSVPGEQRMRGLQSYYRDDQKWSAGPHLFVADDWIWTFTPLTTHGIHSPSWNEISWGIEMVGDYDHEPLSTGVHDNTIAALKVLHMILGKPANTLRFHRDDPATTHRSCPGVNVVREEIQAALQDAIDNA